jgi:hypothetical protein
VGRAHKKHSARWVKILKTPKYVNEQLASLCFGIRTRSLIWYLRRRGCLVSFDDGHSLARPQEVSRFAPADHQKPSSERFALIDVTTQDSEVIPATVEHHIMNRVFALPISQESQRRGRAHRQDLNGEPVEFRERIIGVGIELVQKAGPRLFKWVNDFSA